MEEQPGFTEDAGAPTTTEPQPQPQTTTLPPVPPRPPAPPTTDRDRRPYKRHFGGWVLAVILIIIGVVFLLKNTGWVGENWNFNNWWALFILIPAAGSFGNAWSSYTSAGRRLNAAAIRSLMFGILFVAITVIFLLELNWDKVWPVVLIIIGLGMVFSWGRRRAKNE